MHPDKKEYDGLLLKYGEIALKGKNRNFFENILIKNIKEKLKDDNILLNEIKNIRGRIILKTDNNEKAIESLKKVFGLIYISPFLDAENDMEEIKEKSIKLTAKGTFKVETTRAYKEFEKKSNEVNALVGEAIINSKNLKVDVKNPDFKIYIDITEQGTFIYRDKIKCYGGLPVGTQGKVICLLSGGIDSPVAAWSIMRRGVEIILFHVLMNKNNLSKINRIHKLLQEYSPGHKIELIVIPREEIFKGIRTQLKEAKTKDLQEAQPYTCLFCKYFMIKKAEEIALEKGAKAIVMGDNLGQVASQTLDNLYVIRQGFKLPILSPLLTNDKTETIELAKKIGTYDISIENATCGCDVLPRNPITKARRDEFEKHLETINRIKRSSS